MQITIGTNTLEVLSAGARRLPSGKILVIVEAKQELISHDEFRALFKDTTDDLIVTRDDGTQDTYGGCHYSVKVADDVKTMRVGNEEVEVEIHRAEIECASETEFQLGRLRGTVATQEQVLVVQAEYIGLLEEAVIASEIAITDLDLKDIETEQMLTDIDLRLLELEV